MNISEKTEQKLRQIASERGQDVGDVATKMLEEKVLDTEVSSGERKKLSDFAGLFYGGDGDTAENASEIMRAEINNRSGFG